MTVICLFLVLILIKWNSTNVILHTDKKNTNTCMYNMTLVIFIIVTTTFAQSRAQLRLFCTFYS